MKISLNWLKKYVDVPVDDNELVRLIGARLVEVEGVIDETHKYDNIYIVRVEKCEKIPETHLALCQIDVGRRIDDYGGDNDSGLVQVVCGAPNVHEGMLAVWIAPGAIVPASVHEDAPFEIGKRKMRGYESNGMLAGADELDFGDDHTGIVEIDPLEAQPGDLLADVFELNDLILDIENKSLTHRPDCFGMIGFAREVAGILGQKFEYDSRSEGAESRMDDAKAGGGDSGAKTSAGLGDVAIKIEKPEICQRYSAVVLEKHGEIQKKYLTWQDTVQSKSGMKPISPIVDATNYLMLLTGQPLHAFDYDKFVAVSGGKRPEIIVRLAQEGEKLVLLDDTEIELKANDIVICAGKVPVALAGAMGGKSTMITEETRNIILESATFSLYNLRKTQMAHGIFSEAITRFTKGQPAYQTLGVATECAKMLEGGFKVVSVADEYLGSKEEIAIEITVDEINQLLGTKYSDELIIKTLENVGFEVKGEEDSLTVVAPAWRTDIHIKEDVIEEVGRLLGYDNIEPTLPLHATANYNPMWELKKRIRGSLARLGANEVLTYSFVSEKLLNKFEIDAEKSYEIVNSISPDLQYVRQSIVPSLLEKAYVNQKLPVDRFAIFEMNQVYNKDWGLDKDGVPKGKMALGFVVAERKNRETAYYKAKKYAEELLKELNFSVEFLPIEDARGGFEPKRTAGIWLNGQQIGVVGEFKNSVKHEFKLAPYVAGFEIWDLGWMLERMDNKKTIRFGEKKIEDLTLTTDKCYAEALKEVKAKYPDAEISPLGVYQAVGQKTKNITFRIESLK